MDLETSQDLGSVKYHVEYHPDQFQIMISCESVGVSEFIRYRDELTSTLYEKVNRFADDNTKKEYIIQLTTPNLSYRCVEIFGETGEYVGIHDDVEKIIHLYPQRLFKLSPDLECFYPEKVESEAAVENEEHQDKKQQILSLAQAFGSGRTKRILATRDQLAVADVDTLNISLDMALDISLLNTSENIASEVSKKAEAEDTSPSLPRYDLEATEAKNAYPLSSILTVEDLAALRVPAQEFANIDEENVQKASTTLPSFVVHHLQLLPMIEEAKLLRCSLLKYICYLIELMKSRVKHLRVKKPLTPSMPDAIRNKILREFTEVSAGEDGRETFKTRGIPGRLKTKLLNYLLITCLHVSEFSMNATFIQKDIHIAANRLEKTLRSLGCTVSKDRASGSSIAILKVPLKFPKKPERKERKPSSRSASIYS